MSRHVDQVGVNGEVGQAALVGKQRLPRVAVRPVLANGVLDILTRERVLEFCREDGDAVEEESEVQALVVLLTVVQLPDNREEVALVEPPGLLVQPAGWAEVGEPEPAAHIPDSVAQHVKGTPAPDFRGQALQKLLLNG